MILGVFIIYLAGCLGTTSFFTCEAAFPPNNNLSLAATSVSQVDKSLHKTSSAPRKKTIRHKTVKVIPRFAATKKNSPVADAGVSPHPKMRGRMIGKQERRRGTFRGNSTLSKPCPSSPSKPPESVSGYYILDDKGLTHPLNADWSLRLSQDFNEQSLAARQVEESSMFEMIRPAISLERKF